jgi:hypothetical protein
VALFNTLARISNSLSAVENFRDMVEERERRSGASLNGEHFHKASDNHRMPHQEITEDTKSEKGDEMEEKKRKDIEYDEDFDEFIAENFREPVKPLHGEGETLREIFDKEFSIIWKTFKFVFKAWFGAPLKL